jgi:hypothetical protein
MASRTARLNPGPLARGKGRSKMRHVVNGLILVATFVMCELLAAILGLAANRLPHFVADSSVLGSELILFLLASLSWIPSALLGGAIASLLVRRRGLSKLLSGAFGAVIAIAFVASFRDIQRFFAWDVGTQIGLAFGTLLIIAVYAASVRLLGARAGVHVSAG